MEKSVRIKIRTYSFHECGNIEEVRERYFIASFNKTTLRKQLKSLVSLDSAFHVITPELLSVGLPRQEVEAGNLAKILPMLLKHSPILAAKNGEDFTNGYVIMQEKRKTKMFSLESGEFCDIGVFGETQPLTVMSTNLGQIMGLSDEAMQILEATKPAWEGKLQIADMVNSNTIRAKLPPGEVLRATDDEMKIEGAYRLHSIGLGVHGDGLLDDGYISGTEQWCINGYRAPAAEPGAELCEIDRELYHYFSLGWKMGCTYSQTNFLESKNEYISTPMTPILRKQGGKIFALKWLDVNEEMKAQIAKIQQQHDIFIYYVHYNEGDLSLFYVERNMEEWANARQNLKDGKPTVYDDSNDHLTNFGTDFGTAGIKAISSCHKYIFRCHIPGEGHTWFRPLN